MAGELNPTYANTNVLNYDTNASVLKYQYNLKSARYYDNKSAEPHFVEQAQAIKDDYFIMSEHSHNVTINWTVKTYTWDYSVSASDGQTLIFYSDLSDKVISVSYECNSGSDIKTSVDLSLLVPPDDDFWYANRNYDVKENRENGSYGRQNSIWIPQLYHVVEYITDNETGDVQERNFGYFIPNNNSYSYDSTTNSFNIKLYNLAYKFTEKGGGTIVTTMRSYNYYFDMPYNNSPTSISAYSVPTTPPTFGEESLKEQPSKKTDAELDKEQLLHRETDVLNSIPSRAIKYGTAEILYPTEFQLKMRTVNTPLPLSISGYDNGALMMWDGVLMTMLIYRIAMNRMDVILNNFNLPLVGWHSPSMDAEYTSKSDVFPLGWDFQNGTNVMNIAKTMLNDRYYDASVWVDEERNLCVDTLPTFPSIWRNCIYYSDYAELIISEDIEINDDECYTAVEVYGKNNEYYGICDGTVDGFKVINTGNSESDWRNMLISEISFIPKTKSINDDSIESDVDAYNLAEYELWKSLNNGVSISIKVRDNNIWKFDELSHVVGQQLFEYQLRQGNGKTLRCLLTKASLSGGIWSLELKPFQSFAMSYDWYDTKAYYQFETKFYNQFLGAKWNQSEIDWYNNHSSTYITEKDKHTLSQPVILAWKIISGNILRLYISAIDIGLSVVKVWSCEHNGSVNDSNFLGESVDTDGTDELPWGTPHAETLADLEDGQHIYKVFDYQLTQSGTYLFNCQLYNIFYESSLGSNTVVLEIRLDNGVYLVNELTQKITNENNERLTV